MLRNHRTPPLQCASTILDSLNAYDQVKDEKEVRAHGSIKLELKTPCNDAGGFVAVLYRILPDVAQCDDQRFVFGFLTIGVLQAYLPHPLVSIRINQQTLLLLLPPTSERHRWPDSRAEFDYTLDHGEFVDYARLC